jgi:prepilin-type N-terminal cleavage/methylation domain-containing protein
MRSFSALKTGRRSGVTLIEIMVVIAILGVIAAMAATTAQKMGSRNATQNAASDIGSVLQQSRVLAEQRGSNVVVMVYPTYNKTGPSLTGGRGALFVFEDANGDFMTSTGPCDGSGTTDCGWTNFNPVSGRIVPTTTGRDRLIKKIYLEDYPNKNVKFGNATAAASTWPLPFATLDDSSIPSGCSFCSSNKGAVIITGDQEIQFIDGAGAPTASRVGALTITPATTTPSLTNSFRYGFVAATGLVTLVK